MPSRRRGSFDGAVAFEAAPKKQVGNQGASSASAPADEAFGEALLCVAPALRAYARSLTKNVQDVEDLIQDTLLRAWSARHRFESGTNLQAWARAILYNKFVTDWRRSRFSAEWDDQIADRELVSPAAQPGHIALDETLRALHELPEEQRQALVLQGQNGFSLEEIALVQGAPVGTVKSRLRRGRIALQNAADAAPADKPALQTTSDATQTAQDVKDDDQTSREKRRQLWQERKRLGLTLIG